MAVGLVLSCLAMMPWCFAYYVTRDPARSKAIAIYDRLVPGMSDDQAKRVMANGRMGWDFMNNRLIYCSVDDKYDVQARFDSRMKLKAKNVNMTVNYYLARHAQRLRQPAWFIKATDYIGLKDDLIVCEWP
jgi:hypothetical protein